MANKSLEQLQDEAKNSTSYYAEHLAEVDKTNAVISTKEIKNIENIPLVKKETRITKDVAQRLLKHKLASPLEQQVNIEESIDKNSLYIQFELILQKYPDLKQIHDNVGFEKTFKTLVTSYIVSPLITQKLTVFSKQLPKEFEKTLFCTLLAVNIAYVAKLSKEEIAITYLTGLSHDLGLLHIDPDVFTKKENLTAKEWRSIKTHVIIGYIFVKNLGIEYKNVAKAILEHHERCDSTGYPQAKYDYQLGTVGQIIGIVDSLQAIRVNEFEKVGRNLRYTLPFLKMNFTTYSERVYRATVFVINTLPEKQTPVNVFDSNVQLIQHLISQGDKLSNASSIVQFLIHLSDELELEKDGKNMLRVLEPFDKMIRQSGLVEQHIHKWLEHVISNDSYNPLKELCELELMQNELYWQLKKVRNIFCHFLEQEPNAGSEELMQYLIQVSTEIDNLL